MYSAGKSILFSMPIFFKLVSKSKITGFPWRDFTGIFLTICNTFIVFIDLNILIFFKFARYRPWLNSYQSTAWIKLKNLSFTLIIRKTTKLLLPYILIRKEPLL